MIRRAAFTFSPDSSPPRPCRPRPEEDARGESPAGKNCTAAASGCGTQTQRPEAGVPQAQIVDKLLKMSPAERESALSSLPPARRQNIEKRLEAIQQLPPAQQNRLLYRAEVLNSLPPERANQIRGSIKQFQQLPDERKPVLNQEMRRLMAMPDEQRRDRMNSDDFRSRYSPGEQQMMQDLMEIRPKPQP